MPVIVIGADTVPGMAAIEALAERAGEIRAFVSDPQAAEGLRARGAKVAVGDVSDASHIGGASRDCFCAIVVPEAAFDGRDRSFSDSPAATISGWVEALTDASISRLIWLEDSRVEGAEAGFAEIPEVVTVPTAGRSPDAVAAEAARLEDLDSIPEV